MRILFIETKIDGHHLSYLRSLAENDNNSILLIPEDVSQNVGRTKYVLNPDRSKKLWYFLWIRQVNKIVRREKPDIVHFVYGDDLYRFWGINFPKHVRTVITCHQIRRSCLRDMAYCRIAGKVDTVVVHTAKLEKDLRALGINNVIHIEYPQFSLSPIIADAKEKLEIQISTPVILALGATRQDKGLDILLEALNKVKKPFYLLVAGAEKAFTQAFIDEKTVGYKDHVKTILRVLSDEEFSVCLNAADIVCVPYRKSFDGASGPLGEAVALGKMTVGANHGSLGRLIEENHLGYTFESENVDALAEALNKALSEEWMPDKVYRAYQEELNPERFQRDYIELFKSLFSKGKSE